MVDLVKIRKKAKERESQRGAAAAEAPSPTVESPEAEKTKVAPHAKTAEKPKVAGKSKVIEKPKVAEHSDARSRDAELERDDTKPADATPRSSAEELASFPEREHAPSPSAAAKLKRFKRQVSEERTAAALEVTLEEDSTPQLELLTFLIAEEQYAVDIEHIVEIIPPRKPTRVPNAPPAIGGVISLRGAMVTLVNVRRKLGHAAGDAAGDPRIIVVESAGGTAGFLVDRVLRVSKVDPASVSVHPVVNAVEQREYIKGVFRIGESFFILLDMEKLLEEQVI